VCDFPGPRVRVAASGAQSSRAIFMHSCVCNTGVQPFSKAVTTYAEKDDSAPEVAMCCAEAMQAVRASVSCVHMLVATPSVRCVAAAGI
jgi:hypothetical protein